MIKLIGLENWYNNFNVSLLLRFRKKYHNKKFYINRNFGRTVVQQNRLLYRLIVSFVSALSNRTRRLSKPFHWTACDRSGTLLADLASRIANHQRVRSNVVGDYGAGLTMQYSPRYDGIRWWHWRRWMHLYQCLGNIPVLVEGAREVIIRKSDVRTDEDAILIVTPWKTETPFWILTPLPILTAWSM